MAYALSVPPAFDLELSRLLLGDESVPVVRELLRLGILRRVDDEHNGVMRYHRLVREVLERELRDRQPVWHEQLVRRAASICVERGDLAGAHAHLVAIGDVGAAMRLVVTRAFSFVDRGDAEAVSRLALAFPPRSDVADPSLALDMSTLSFFAAQRDESRKWCMLAAQLVEPNDRRNLLRLHAMRAVLALMDGALDDVGEHLHSVTLSAMDTEPPDDPMTKWTSLTETRLALVNGRLHEAAIALDHARRAMDAPPTVSEVTVPALVAWLHLERGDLAGALALADAACVWADAEDVRYHHGVLEALVVLGHCRLAAGDLAAAAQLARRSHAYAATLGYRWDVIRAGTLDAEVQRLGAGSAASLEVVDRLRSELGDLATSMVTEHLDRAEAAALVDAGHLGGAHLDAAWSAIVRLPHGASRSLLEARHAAAIDDHGGVAAAVAHRRSWPTAQRLEAEVLLSTTGSPRPQALLAALRVGAAGGWVAPFLPHMARIRQLLDGPSIVHEHPVFVVAAAAVGRAGAVADPLAATSLTGRERSLLEFLPSHLSYAQIAARTFLSVNTVKSNLKSIYRKLGVASHAEAVDLARDAGLI